MVAVVLLLPVPAITCAFCSLATSTVSLITRSRSASSIVTLSPVVPHGTRIFTPPFICRSTSFLKHSSSTDPSFLKGVTRAVAQPRIQSIFIVIFIGHRYHRLTQIKKRKHDRQGVCQSLNTVDRIKETLQFRQIKLSIRPDTRTQIKTERLTRVD